MDHGSTVQPHQKRDHQDAGSPQQHLHNNDAPPVIAGEHHPEGPSLEDAFAEQGLLNHPGDHLQLQEHSERDQDQEIEHPVHAHHENAHVQGVHQHAVDPDEDHHPTDDLHHPNETQPFNPTREFRAPSYNELVEEVARLQAKVAHLQRQLDEASSPGLTRQDTNGIASKRKVFVCAFPGCNAVRKTRTGMLGHEIQRHGRQTRFRCDHCFATNGSKNDMVYFVHQAALKNHLFKFRNQGTHPDAESPRRLCQHADGCARFAVGSTPFCKSHGGGTRCVKPGCSKAAAQGILCIAHGGGKRCRMEGCANSAVGRTDLCRMHGGGKRCLVEGCGKSAQGSTSLCKAHGGGKRCKEFQCTKSARGSSGYCRAHATENGLKVF